jgi:hypothetical protein
MRRLQYFKQFYHSSVLQFIAFLPSLACMCCSIYHQKELVERANTYSDVQEVVINPEAITNPITDKSSSYLHNYKYLMRRQKAEKKLNLRQAKKAGDSILIWEQERSLQRGREYEKKQMRILGPTTRVMLRTATSLLCYGNALVANKLTQQYPKDIKYSRQITAIECYVNNSATESVDLELGIVPVVRAGSHIYAELNFNSFDAEDDEVLFSIVTQKDIVATPIHTAYNTTTDIPFYPFQEVLLKDDKFYQVGKTYTTRKYTIPPRVIDYTIALLIIEFPGLGSLTSLHPEPVSKQLKSRSHCMQSNKHNIQLNFNPQRSCYPKEITSVNTQQMLYYEMLFLTKIDKQQEFQILEESKRLEANAYCIWDARQQSTITTLGIASNFFSGSPVRRYVPYTLADLKTMPRGISQRLACFLEPIRSGTGVSLQDGQCVKAHPEDDLLRLHTNITLNLSKVLDELSSITGTDNESTGIFD